MHTFQKSKKNSKNNGNIRFNPNRNPTSRRFNPNRNPTSRLTGQQNKVASNAFFNAEKSFSTPRLYGNVLPKSKYEQEMAQAMAASKALSAEWQRKMRYLKSAALLLNMKVHDVIGDGRCSPGVMGFQMERMVHGTVVQDPEAVKQMADDVRATVCAGIESDPYLEDGYPIFHFVKDCHLKQYVTELKKPATFFDNVAIRAAAKVLGYNINIVITDDSALSCTTSNDVWAKGMTRFDVGARRTIWMGHIVNHYVALVPKDMVLCFFLVGSRPGAPGEVFFVI